MKVKTAIFLIALTVPIIGSAYWDTVGVFQSSFTLSSEGPRIIPNTPPGTIFVGVVVGTSSAGGSLKIYDSSGTAGLQLANISLQGDNESYRYNIYLSSGLTYTTLNNTGGVTILYKRTR